MQCTDLAIFFRFRYDVVYEQWKGKKYFKAVTKLRIGDDAELWQIYKSYVKYLDVWAIQM